MLVIKTIIVCDNCGAMHGGDMDHLSGMQHREQMRLHGWAYTGNRDLCGDCRPHTKKGKFYNDGKKVIRRKRVK